MDPKFCRLWSWEGDLPEFNHYMKTDAGSMYLVIGVKPNTRPNPKTIAKLDLLKLTPEEIEEVPDDAVVHYMRWGSRPS